ncbi:hypothetical protein BJV82DRAFT_612464 [Fennellomyces sp. T-0311]|nr:hypothetical protein BJV82DRAFT_612464 [Fennellomyces sp. T-0311]
MKYLPIAFAVACAGSVLATPANHAEMLQKRAAITRTVETDYVTRTVVQAIPSTSTVTETTEATTTVVSTEHSALSMLRTAKKQQRIDH